MNSQIMNSQISDVDVNLYDVGTFWDKQSVGRSLGRGVARDVPGLESGRAHLEHLRSLGFREQGDFSERFLVHRLRGGGG